VVSGLGAGVAAADQMVPAAPAPDKADIAQEVLDDLEATGTADFWLRFDARPDMSQFSRMADWDARGWAVYEALNSTAKDSQAEAVRTLRTSDLDFQSFYITNAIKVEGAGSATVDALAALPGVDAIYPSFEVTPPETVRETDSGMVPNAVAWGVEDINAPDVWDLGITGEGIVVASIDTGVQWDHPALVGHYRGNNGDGTFDHNYNWYNDGHGNADFPNDGNGHGTHVTGTMVGDDGGENQIGVAPGATWIAANGCCPSDAALIASGEWMLAPTDLAGQNPDPGLRPHVINNSWGSIVPSNDPFMEDISEAWAAAGQFGVFANGNSGPACNTSGSPGSRIINYSVGNYNSGHTIATLSGRGAGQDGAIKPDISAPGSAIYSAWPGDGYNTISGTSMASPHVAGAVGLLWSGSPSMLGDVEGTRALLDSTAIDTEDLQCGGTAANNNVFGEGRLDVAALLAAAPMDAGTLTGTVTDSVSGDPVSSATVAVTGSIDRTIQTDASGGYTLVLSAGDYTVEVSRFGYATATATVTITEEATTTHDVALDPSASATVSGTVTDGSGLGGPLAATVTVDGTPLSADTDPATGQYALSVPAGDYTLTATPTTPGYLPASQPITVGTEDVVANFALLVDPVACSVPGYTQERIGSTEPFDATTAPDGWTVTDDEGSGQVWSFTNPGGQANLTGGSGNFAIVDNDFYGSAGVQRTGLVSPTLDYSDATYPVVEFKQDFRVFNNGELLYADVDFSLDGGTTWTTALHQTAQLRGPVTTTVPLPEAAGESDVQVRFYNVDEGWSWWWQVDDVWLGHITCTADDVPRIEVDPAEVTSTQEQETTTSHEVEVANTGTADLTWVVTEAEAEYVPGAPDTSLVLPQGADRSGTQPAASSAAPARVPAAHVPAVASFTEAFNDITTLPGAGWAMINTSEPIGLTNWFQGNPTVFDAHEGAPAAYIAANWNNAGSVPGDISNWLVTPEVDLVNGSELTFWTRTIEDQSFADRLEVRMSTSGASTDVGTGYDTVGDFTEQLLVINEGLGSDYPEAWTEYTVTIEGLSEATTGRLAFRYHVPDGGPAGSNSDFIGIDTVSYEAADVPPPTTSCDSPTDIGWLSVSPTSGTTAGGASTAVNVGLDATGLALGDYSAQLCIASNDPATPLVEVPVTLTVTEAPEETPVIGVDPAAVSSTQEQETTTTHEVAIDNTGTGDLTWVVTEAEADYAPGAPDASLVLPQGADRSGTQPAASGSAPARVPAAHVPAAVASFTEVFDDITTLPGAGWAMINTSEPVGVTNWFQGNPLVFDAHEGAPAAYIAANWNNSGASPGHISNWLITPEVDLVNGSELTFWTRTIENQSFPDRLEVRMSTAGASTDVGTGYATFGDFTEQLLVINEGLGTDYPESWTSYTVTIEGLSEATTGRLAFRYHVPDGGPNGVNSDFIGIDTVSYEAADVTPPTSCESPTDIGWLSVSPTSGTTAPGGTSTLEVALDATGLAVGDYSAQLCIASNDPATPLVQVPVTLTVTEAPEEIPVIGVDPAAVSATQEQETTTSHEVEVANTGTGDLTWDVTEAEAASCESPSDIGWLSASPTSGTTAPGGTSTLEVTLDATGLAAGDYSAQLCIASNDPATPLVQVPVTLTVTEPAPPELIVDRLFGPDRYATAAAISQALHTPGVDTVYVATGAAYADALAGSALAGSEEVPVLLTRGDHLNLATAAELDRLDPGRVVLFGGDEAITEEVADLIGEAAEAPVTRLSGADRYATAATIAGEFDGADVVYIATGQEFADALAGAARAGALDAPVLLVRTDHLPNATAAALTALTPSEIRVLGGEDAVSADVATALGDYGTVTRIAGDNRYETAVQITSDYPSAATVYLASGQQWPDALAGGALAGATDQPLLLTKVDKIPAVVGPELQRLAPPRVVLLGGESVVGAEIVDALHALLP